MNPTKTLLVLLLALAGFASAAQTLKVGDLVPVISAKDQHGQTFLLTTNIQRLLIVTEMACAKSANHKLADQGLGFLEKHRAAYLMDIHTMPAIGRFSTCPRCANILKELC